VGALMSNDQEQRRESAISKCVALLLDDRERQGGVLSVDDVSRMISRRGLTPEEIGAVWTALQRQGVDIREEGAANAAEARDTSAKRPQRPQNTFSTAECGVIFARHELLSHADEIRLGRRYRAGQLAASAGGLAEQAAPCQEVVDVADAARAQLVLHNIRLVIHYANKHRELTDMPLDDLIQEGILGLFRAIEKWEPERGYRFATYASWWIMQSLSRAIADRGRLIRIPVHIKEQLSLLRKRRRKLSLALGRQPSEAELARELGWGIAEINLLDRLQRDVQSLDVADDGPTEKQLRRIPSRIESPVRSVEREELKALITRLLDTLDSRSRAILVFRFGLLGNKRRTLEQIGKRFKVTRERIRQIEKRALQKIAGSYRAKPLRVYMESMDDDIA
jgi:RNA polymerase primary sigma factor